MIDAVNSHAREVDGRKQYPRMYGADGWYGWRNAPWNVGALETWYWSQAQRDQERVADNAWVRFLRGRDPGYPERVLTRDLNAVEQRLKAVRRDTTPPQ